MQVHRRRRAGGSDAEDCAAAQEEVRCHREKEAGETDVVMLLMRGMRVRFAWLQWALSPECFGGLRRRAEAAAAVQRAHPKTIDTHAAHAAATACCKYYTLSR